MGPTWVLPAPDGPHVGSMNLTLRDTNVVQLPNVSKRTVNMSNINDISSLQERHAICSKIYNQILFRQRIIALLRIIAQKTGS